MNTAQPALIIQDKPALVQNDWQYSDNVKVMKVKEKLDNFAA